MEIETLNIKALRPKEDKLLNCSLLTFDMPILIEKMKNSNTWAKGELSSMILLKTAGKRIVLTALHGGTEIESFQSNDSITLQIIEGRVGFHTPKESRILNKGQSLTLNDKIKYSMTISEETVLLLTIVNNTLQPADN